MLDLPAVAQPWWEVEVARLASPTPCPQVGEVLRGMRTGLPPNQGTLGRTVPGGRYSGGMLAICTTAGGRMLSRDGFLVLNLVHFAACLGSVDSASWMAQKMGS